ncbi:hypothetical protein [Naasia lichenicola]|uniref:Uncharacterized protein n=1 Tax=Naasia lichenicola TaxID=2565933 RepID=A0A4S4FEG4_9MICO|nr:hypothetical protein [Naasia lichenicola]THG28471.1 hypothetical protein E6C64_16720 [Naasia lichenicola]
MSIRTHASASPSTAQGRRSRLRVLLALLAVVLLVPSLAACSSNPVGDFVSDATGGGVDLAGDKLPSDFPTAVPVIEGDVIAGIGLGEDDAKVWNVTIRSASTDAVKDAVVAKFTDAGWTEGAPIQTDNGVVYTDGTYTAVVIVIEDGGKWTVNYIVGKDASAVENAA